MNKFTPTGAGNEVLKIDDILISYRDFKKHPSLLSSWKPDEGFFEETAVKFKDSIWYVLNGDFRKEFAEVFPDKEKIMQVIERNKEHASSWGGLLR